MRRYVVERDVPEIGCAEEEALKHTAARSNEVLKSLGGDIQWIESYVAADKTFCVYFAKDEEAIRRHAELSGFPLTRITEIQRIIDPTTAAS